MSAEGPLKHSPSRAEMLGAVAAPAQGTDAAAVSDGGSPVSQAGASPLTSPLLKTSDTASPETFRPEDGATDGRTSWTAALDVAGAVSRRLARTSASGAPGGSVSGDSSSGKVGAAPASPHHHDIEAAREYETLEAEEPKLAPPTHRARNFLYFLLFFLFLVVNDGLTGVLAAYLSRTRMFDGWLHFKGIHPVLGPLAVDVPRCINASGGTPGTLAVDGGGHVCGYF